MHTSTSASIGRGRATLLALLTLAASLLVIATPAGASAPFSAPFNCPGAMSPGGCYFDPFDLNQQPLWLDYAIPTDGTTQQWDFTLVNNDPNASISLNTPNDVFQVATWQRWDGSTYLDFGGGPPATWTWEEASGPGHVSYRVSGSQSFDNCDHIGVVPPIPDRLCAVAYYIWTDPGMLTINTTEPGQLYISWRTVPEPATWGLLIAGLGLVGAALRRHRARLAPVVV